MSKAKVFIKKSATIVMALMFMLMTNVFVARAEEKSVDGVKISISTDEESYTVGNEDDAKVTVTFENTNQYEVTVDSVSLTSSYFVAEDNTILPSSITLAAGAKESFTVPMSYTFKKWVKEIEFHNAKTGKDEKLNVGLVASYATIAPTSTFHVDCFDATETEHAEYLKNLDPFEDGTPVEHATIFDLSLKDSSGALISQFNGYGKLYLQVPTGWDAKELQAIFISSGDDEEFIEKLEIIDDVQYVTFITNHFSPYALVDPGVLAPAKGATPSPKTGDASMKVLLPLVVSAVIFLTLCLLMGKKRRTAMLAIVLCAGVSVYAVGTVAVSKLGSEDFSIGFNDFVKRESADSADTAAVDAGLNVAYSVSYEGPTLVDIVYDYDYSGDYYGGPFKIKIAGGPEGWVGKLIVENTAMGEGHSFPVDFSKLTKEADGSRWFEFDPVKNSAFSDELEVGDTLKLVDNHGNECDKVVLESGNIEQAN